MNCVIFALLLLVTNSAIVAQADGTTPSSITAIDYSRSTIYHSPQTPGYTCWVSAWIMPDDKSMWVCFTQATGPIEGRPKTPPDIRKKLSWPPPGVENYDMNGLKMENIYLRSDDRGKTWEKMSADTFRSPVNAMGDKGTTALKDGTILREVWGEYLPFDKSVPTTGFVQLSSDQTKSWSKPILLLNPEKYSAYPVRIRQLRDGRVMVLGGFIRSPIKNDLTRHQTNARLEPLLVISADGGRTWQDPLEFVPEELRQTWQGEECDAAELPNGDLFLVFRRNESDNAPNVRWQALLKKDGDTWKTERIERTSLAPGGHPELLYTQEGVVLYLTYGGTQAWTADAGKTWHNLEVPLSYYPRSVQTADGQIFVFGHMGYDDAYGTTDQSIVMDTFRLSPKANN
jgi:hypothetical protein